MFEGRSRLRRAALIASATLTLLLVAAWITSAFLYVGYFGSSPLAPEQLFVFGRGEVGVSWGIGGKSEFGPTPKGIMIRRGEGDWPARLGFHSDFMIAVTPFGNFIFVPIWLLSLVTAIAFAILLRRPRPEPVAKRRSNAFTIALLLPPLCLAALWALSTKIGIEVKTFAFDASLRDGAIAFDRPFDADEDEIRPACAIRATHADGNMGFRPFEIMLTSSYFKIPMWLILLATAWPAYAAWRRLRPRRPEGCCPCGYNLTLNQSGICPECGSKITRPGERATTANDTGETQNSEPRTD